MWEGDHDIGFDDFPVYCQYYISDSVTPCVTLTALSSSPVKVKEVKSHYHKVTIRAA